MEPFILRYTWFTLNYIFKNLGLDLLKRDGEGKLKQTSACRFWIRVVCTYVVVDLLYALIYCYILIVETTPEDFMTALKEIFFNSKTNTYVFLCNNLLISIITFFIIFKLRILARGLVGIQDYYKKYALIDAQATKKIMKKIFLAIFPCMIVLTIGVSLSVVGSNVIIFSKLNVPTVWQSLLYTFNVLIFMIYGTPFWYFFSFMLRLVLRKIKFKYLCTT